MALVKLKLRKAEDISWYLNETTNKSIRCYVNPQLFVELFEFSVHNPWQVLRDAIVNHSLSIFFNGNEEEKDVVQSHDEMNQMIANVPYIFENIIDVYFDTNDMALVRKVLYQFGNCHSYFSRKREVTKEQMDVLNQYLWHDYFHPGIAANLLAIRDAILMQDVVEPPRKKRRINAIE
eukprot:581622_1